MMLLRPVGAEMIQSTFAVGGLKEISFIELGAEVHF